MALPAAAEDLGPSYTTFGTTGLIEMPTAESAERSQFATTLSYTQNGSFRSTLNYQLTDRLSGAFRFSVFDIYRFDTTLNPIETFDRSFDLQFRLIDEGQYRPAIAVGLRDFLGTGRYASEYVVATKSVGDALKLTGGIGWGRMGQRDSFANPLGGIADYFNTRPIYDDRINGEGANGGTVSYEQFFRGDAALFAGLEYQVTPTLGFKAEYSSIEYNAAQFDPFVDYESPWNVALTYRPRRGVTYSAAYLYGTEFSVQATFSLSPERRDIGSGLESAPVPIRVRTSDQRAAQSWDSAAQPQAPIQAALEQLLEVEGITLIGLELSDNVARLRYENGRYRSEAQAMGRAARMLTQVAPASINVFVMEPVKEGLPLSAVRLSRLALEGLENKVGATEGVLGRAEFGPAGPADGLRFSNPEDPAFTWGIGPYFSYVFFSDPDDENLDVGLRFDAQYQITPNLSIAGRVNQSALGEQEPLFGFDTPNSYANVRTDKGFYGRHGNPTLEYLTLTHYSRLGPDIYSRVTAGYLEKMYGGVSTEVLWKPVTSRLALGAEVNYAIMRHEDMDFRFAQVVRTDDAGGRAIDGDYEIVTGHLSAYYDFGNGYHAQVDLGRYLAGDWGATFSLDREFENGWRLGGFFTLTDMPAEEFGEGSFDKGLRLTIPIDYFVGTPTQRTFNQSLRSLARDGGARLEVDGRLYDLVRPGHEAHVSETFGRFWR